MYVEKLRVLDFKCFDHAEASFVHPKSVLAPAPFETFNNVNVLLGNNGAGKTSILRAVAL
jgi:recombinational DNA repair ATPase RecF